MSSEEELDDFTRADKLCDERRFEEAFQIFMAMAKRGDVTGMDRVANMYDDGEGVRRSRGRAITWYLKAIDAGSSIARHNLGLTYLRNRDTRRARYWLEKSLACGHRDSALDLAHIFLVSEREFDRIRGYLQVILCDEGWNEVSVATYEEAEKLLAEIDAIAAKKASGLPASSNERESNAFQFLNIDIDMRGGARLSRLASLLSDTLFVAHESDGAVALNLRQSYSHLDAALSAVIGAIEIFETEARAIWDECREKCFNIGVKCGSEHSFVLDIDPHYVSRIAKLGARIQVTMYGREVLSR